jgi:hypothetical protein
METADYHDVLLNSMRTFEEWTSRVKPLSSKAG